jgi:Methyltransferase domain
MLEKRTRTPELMDGDGFDADLAEASYRFIERTNRFFGGISSVRNFIRRQLEMKSGEKPLHVLDLGSGGCDIPIALSRWADRRNLPITFTCVEKNRHAANHARKRICEAGLSSIQVVEEDVFSFLAQSRKVFDCATASMFFHHLDEEEIGGLLLSLPRTVRGPLLISDLKRSAASYFGCWLYTLGSHAGVRMDARTSVLRSFSTAELERILADHPAVSDSEVRSHRFLRIEGIAHP